MSISQTQTHRAGGLLPSALKAINSRLRGPGGYYNLGNCLGLSVSLGLQLSATGSSIDQGLGKTLQAFFMGSPAAMSMTACTMVFIIGGEVYRAAWANGAPPDQRLNRIGDLISAIGSVLLSLSLLLMGQTMLAIVSAILSGGGKLGSAITGDDISKIPFWPLHWPDPMRLAVLVGRAPGLAAAILDASSKMAQGGASQDLLQPVTLIVCYLLWIKADWMLFLPRPKPAPQQA